MTSSRSPGEAAETIGGFGRQDRLWVIGLFGLGGAVVGAILPYAARLAADLPWMPFEGPVRLLGDSDQQWLLVGRPLLGLVAGVVFSAWVIINTPVLHLSGEGIRVERRGAVERVIDRSTVAAVYRRRSQTVIETREGRRLFDDEVEGDKTAIRDAFVRLGYPWEGPPPGA